MISDILKEGTASAHSALEKRLVAHIREIGSIPDYIALLAMLHPYHRALGRVLDPYTPAGWENPARVTQLEADIRFFDNSLLPSGSKVPEVPVISCKAAALGAFYVLEGSTLGGQHITRMIARKLIIDPIHGFSFFNPYGDQTNCRWEKFRQLLNNSIDESQSAITVEAANQIFLTYNHWISQHESVCY